MGWVGSSVAISLLLSGVVDELLVHDLRHEIAEGEAMDLAHGASFYPTAKVRVADLSEMKNANIIIVTAGKAGVGDQSRLELLRDNIRIIRQIGQELTGFKGIIVMLTNPVDILTKVMTHASGLPPSRVIGTGTMLDTARLRRALGARIGVDPHSVHANVVGEHGDSEVILWSSAHVGGVPLSRFHVWNAEQKQAIAAEVRNAAYEIISRKGATNHAIGLATTELVRCMLRGERRILTVSRCQDGASGIFDVALSLPTIVEEKGAVQILEPELNQEEYDALIHSADVLRQALQNAEQPPTKS